MEVGKLSMKPLTAYRLIAIDKCPGVRPTGIGGVSRWIMSKAILAFINADIQEVVGGSYQLCVGQACGCEVAIHALSNLFEKDTKDTTEGVLLVDASNAFNNLNRKATLMNVRRICPSFAAILTNTYRSDLIRPSSLMAKPSCPVREPH